MTDKDILERAKEFDSGHGVRKYDTLEDYIDNADEIIRELIGEVKRLRELEKEYTSWREESRKMADQYKKIKLVNESLTKELERLRKELASWEEDLEDVENAQEAMEEEQIGAMQHQIESLTSELEEVKTAKEQNDENYTNCIASINEEKEKLKAENKELKECNERLNKIEISQADEIAELKATVKEQKQELEWLPNAEQVIKELKAKVEELDARTMKIGGPESRKNTHPMPTDKDMKEELEKRLKK